MALKPEQITELKRCYSGLALVKDGEVEFILISPLLLPAGCEPHSVDGLLCPVPRDGYSSRLFLSQKITHSGKGVNWNADGVLIANRKWWAVSWKTNKDDLTLLGMVLTHLDAFK
jgi:hypothetical protein